MFGKWHGVCFEDMEHRKKQTNKKKLTLWMCIFCTLGEKYPMLEVEKLRGTYHVLLGLILDTAFSLEEDLMTLVISMLEG